MNFKEYLDSVLCEAEDIKAKQMKAKNLNHVGYGNYKDKQGKVYQWDEKKKKFVESKEENTSSSVNKKGNKVGDEAYEIFVGWDYDVKEVKRAIIEYSGGDTLPKHEVFDDDGTVIRVYDDRAKGFMKNMLLDMFETSGETMKVVFDGKKWKEKPRNSN